MAMTIVTRSQWGASPWHGKVYTVPSRIRTEFFVHYDGGTAVHRTGLAVPRGIEIVHLNNGWAGIGYNFVVDQLGNIYEGRGWDIVGAHCPNHNRTGIGVQIAIGNGQVPPDIALSRVVDLYEEACRRSGHLLAKKGHRDGYATDCPGDLIERWVRGGMKRPGGSFPNVPVPPVQPRPGVPAPLFPLSTGWYFGPESGPYESVSGYHGHRDNMRTWQARMHARGWDIAADGLYGPVTARVARNFQKEKGLRIDGLIGPVTWHAAWEMPIT